MPTITYELPARTLSALRLSVREFAREMMTAACVQWYSQGIISQGKAAEIAGMSRGEFIDELARRGVPVIQVTEEELERELEYLREHRG